MKKVALLGGSSAFAPAFVRDLAAANPPPLSLVLWGRNAERVGWTRTASAFFAAGSALEIRATADLDEALEGASLLVQQIRVGGLAARHHDETFPLRRGIPGDEGIGPGGLAASIRSAPVLRSFADRIGARAPGAVVVNLTAPLGPTTAILREAGVEAWGVCELPRTTRRDIETALGGPAPLAYLGVNHQGFFYGFPEGPRLPLDQAFRAVAAGFPVAVWSNFEAVPLRHLRLVLDADRVVTEQRARGRTRAAELFELSRRLFEAYAAAHWEAARASLARRVTVWYAEGVVPLLLDLLDGRGGIHYLTLPNCSDSPGRPRGAVLELACRLESGHPVPLPTAEPPRAVGELLSRLFEFERLSVRAAADPSAENVRSALRAHPLVGRDDVAEALVDPVLERVEEWNLAP